MNKLNRMSKDIGDIAMYLIKVRDTVKLYHWTTTNYARHIAADTLVGMITMKMDLILETIQGSRGLRAKVNGDIKIKNMTDTTIVPFLKSYKNWLINTFTIMLKNDETDLLNIRDEMISDVNKILYLFTLE